MTNNTNKPDTHISNIINNPPKVFTEPCEACGVSEFQLGVKHAEERIIKLLEERAKDFLRSEYDRWLRNEVVLFDTDGLIELIKGESKFLDKEEN